MKTHGNAKKTKVHFMGIGGSGIGAVALLAKAAGFEVEGSDLQSDTPYLSKVINAGIKTYVGHESTFLDSVDILAVTPAVFFNPQNDFIDAAKAKNIPVMTWQEFMGKYLHKDKTVVAIAGAHGKSTTTAMVGLCFERAGFDPTVEVGARVLEWDSNIRVGESNIFVSEADEFYDNFLHYNPDTIVLTSVEYEHPDYFKNETQYFDSFRRFVSQLTGSKRLIVNLDDSGTKNLIESIPTLSEDVDLVGYTVENPLFQTKKMYKVNTYNNNFSQYDYSGPDDKAHTITLTASGKHNIYNSLAVSALCSELSLDFASVSQVLASFTGIGRRLETIGTKSGISVIDDYAHHPTEIKASLSAVKSRNPGKRVLAIIEPHSYSRTKEVLQRYKGIERLADEIFIAPIFKARDTSDFGVSEKDICTVIGPSCKPFTDMQSIIDAVRENKSKYDIVIVMGAGKSYQLSRDILTTL